MMLELLFTPDSSVSETDSDVDNQEDWQYNANAVTGSIRGNTAEPDGDMTFPDEEQIISEQGGEDEEDDALEVGEFRTMAVIDSFEGDYTPIFLL